MSFLGADTSELMEAGQTCEEGAQTVDDVIKFLQALVIILKAAGWFTGGASAAYAAYLEGTVIPWLRTISTALHLFARVLMSNADAQDRVSAGEYVDFSTLPTYTSPATLPAGNTYHGPTAPAVSPGPRSGSVTHGAPAIGVGTGGGSGSGPIGGPIAAGGGFSGAGTGVGGGPAGGDAVTGGPIGGPIGGQLGSTSGLGGSDAGVGSMGSGGAGAGGSLGSGALDAGLPAGDGGDSGGDPVVGTGAIHSAGSGGLDSELPVTSSPTEATRDSGGLGAAVAAGGAAAALGVGGAAAAAGSGGRGRGHTSPDGYDYNAIRGVQNNRHVTDEFLRKVEAIAGRIGARPEHLLAVMSFETGGTFDPAQRNPHSTGTGLIQFMDRTARRSLGTTTQALSRMSAVDQLDYVERFLTERRGNYSTLEGLYSRVLAGHSVADPQGALFRAGTDDYLKNSGLDLDHDGVVTSGEAATRVRTHIRR